MDNQTAHSQFDTGSFIRSLISYTVGVTLLIVAGFGIYNILNMMIYEKLDSIATHPEIVHSQVSGSVADEIKKLAELRESGFLTLKEFNQQKAKLLAAS